MSDLLSFWKWQAVVVLALALGLAGPPVTAEEVDARMEDKAAIGRLFSEHCAVCHGDQLQGAAQGVALVGRNLTGGASAAELQASIGRGAPDKGMPLWSETLSETQIRALAIYIAEKRAGFKEGDEVLRISDPIVVPDGIVSSEQQDFRVSTFIAGLDPLPYSMAFLPDGSLLLTEKHNGLTRISRDGRKTLIAGTPRIRGRDKDVMFYSGVDMSNGWMLGVAVHPRYRTNGWIYLSFGDLCDDCPRTDPNNPMAPSMTKVVRGRIRGGQWVDQQLVWSVGREHYTQQTDLLASGRMAFDDNGHVFIVVGMKNLNDGVQDLRRPWGKIHRVHDDGRIPADNPFVNTPEKMASVWSYGHRVPQGLFYNSRTDRLWSSEHGPRGGDEINLIRGGRNYGWPLTSLGVNYDGTKVDGWQKYGVSFDLSAIEQPVVEFTPSPALSAFVICRGQRFPAWKDNFIVGSLKARELYRVVLKDDQVVHRETLLRDVGRIRDLQQGPEGDLWLLIEHTEGGKILRLSLARGRGAASRR